MTRRWETFEHASDLGLQARAGSLVGLFEALAEGLAGVVCPAEQIASRDKRVVRVEAEDVEALAVDFLAQVLGLLQTERFLVATARVIELARHEVAAELCGEPYDPGRHELEAEVKAVTYHRLKIAQEDGEWIGRVVLDL